MFLNFSIFTYVAQSNFEIGVNYKWIWKRKGEKKWYVKARERRNDNGEGVVLLLSPFFLFYINVTYGALFSPNK